MTNHYFVGVTPWGRTVSGGRFDRHAVLTFFNARDSDSRGPSVGASRTTIISLRRFLDERAAVVLCSACGHGGCLPGGGFLLAYPVNAHDRYM